ncbi:hypothetical protein A9W98_16815 [Mycobacterium gordonae]|uniref:Uncharacterized protein n=1 Tax=Mycobacterium gordonae TaxID=1778 RepID=A0A1A6BI91_MYCGO|nr:hypothetical protein A9W98_16815 [Mycobacterium gordonae]
MDRGEPVKASTNRCHHQTRCPLQRHRRRCLLLQRHRRRCLPLQRRRHHHPADQLQVAQLLVVVGAGLMRNRCRRLLKGRWWLLAAAVALEEEAAAAVALERAAGLVVAAVRRSLHRLPPVHPA